MQGGCARRVTGSDSGRHFSKIHKQFLYGNWENEKKPKMEHLTVHSPLQHKNELVSFIDHAASSVASRTASSQIYAQ